MTKRSQPEEDDLIGIEPKRVKYNDSSTDSDIEMATKHENEKSGGWSKDMKDVFASTQNVLNNAANSSPSAMREFVTKMKELIDESDDKLKELEWREKHRVIDITWGGKYKIDEKILRFVKKMIKGCRFRVKKTEIDKTPWTFYQVDVALKSVIPHPKYKDKMHSLLDKSMPCDNVRDVIIDYAQVGYRWYRYEFKTEDSPSCYDGLDFYYGCIWTIRYCDDDYFRDNAFYYAADDKPRLGEAVKISKWREVLYSKYMKDMTDDDLAIFIGEVEAKLLNSGHFSGNVKWILERHS